MKSNVLFVYDNRKRLDKSIKNIVGLDTYGDIVYKRKTLKTRLKNVVDELSVDYFYLSNDLEKDKLIELVKSSKYKILHLYSNCIVSDVSKVKILIEKIKYLTDPMKIENESVLGFAFNDKEEYINFLSSTDSVEHYSHFDSIEPSDCFEDISNYEKFLTFFSGGFEARHFNNISGDKYIITKTSDKKEKIKSEHDYYYLIPDNMKWWFVTPFNYTETKDTASYSMERVNAPDMALQWVHEAISIKDFETLLEKIFFFINSRGKKEITKEEYLTNMDKLYVKKVKDRIEELKKLEKFSNIDNYIKMNGKYSSIDEIFNEYIKLYEKIALNNKFDYVSVIGHGDLCFSNMIYYKEINLLKFIDVKGALTEKDLWTDPYYDLAKLSHSICGSYDFFNNSMYEIQTNENCNVELKIMNKNLSEYKELFKKIAQKNKFDYKIIRIYEASLFLSMLPLHMDNPKKVIGFVLNAIDILEEIKNGI